MSDPLPEDGAPKRSASYAANLSQFWRGNVRIMLVLLSIWAIAGLGCGILFADSLNEIRIGGFPLGFWFAQQGSIVVFVLLILAFCLIMNKRDEAHHEALKEEDNQSGGGI